MNTCHVLGRAARTYSSCVCTRARSCVSASRRATMSMFGRSVVVAMRDGIGPDGIGRDGVELD